VTTLLLVSLIGCCVGAFKISELYALNPFGLPLLR